MKTKILSTILFFTFIAGCMINQLPILNYDDKNLKYYNGSSISGYRSDFQRAEDAFTIKDVEGWISERSSKFQKYEQQILYTYNPDKTLGECTLAVRPYKVRNKIWKRTDDIYLEKNTLNAITNSADNHAIMRGDKFIEKSYVNAKNSFGVRTVMYSPSMYRDEGGIIMQFIIRNHKRQSMLRVFCSSPESNSKVALKSYEKLISNIEVK